MQSPQAGPTWTVCAVESGPSWQWLCARGWDGLAGCVRGTEKEGRWAKTMSRMMFWVKLICAWRLRLEGKQLQAPFTSLPPCRPFPMPCMFVSTRKMCGLRITALRAFWGAVAGRRRVPLPVSTFVPACWIGARQRIHRQSTMLAHLAALHQSISQAKE
jgi:hypothetical protein